jgi:hypothetical protein
VAEGLDAFRPVLAEFGITVPSSRGAALRSAMWGRLRFILRGMRFQPRPASQIAPEVLERLDALWGIRTGLLMLDWALADAFGQQHLHETLDCGEPERVVRTLAAELSMEAALGGRFFDRRCDAMVRATETAQSASDQASLRAWTMMMRGATSWFHGKWADAWANCHAAYKIYNDECRAVTWEMSVCDVFGLSALTYLGDIAELVKQLPAVHRAVRERGDLYATSNLAFFESYALLAHDRPDDAVRIAEDAIRPFPRSKLLSIHYGIDYALSQGKLYRGDIEAAWHLMATAYPDWKAMGNATLQGVRVEVHYLRARIALAVIEQKGPARHDAERVLEDAHRHLAKDALPAARPLAEATRAAQAHLAGRRRMAIAGLHEAARGFDEQRMSLHSAACRHQLSRLGAPGYAGASKDAEGYLREQGVVRPERLLWLTLPGFGS